MADLAFVNQHNMVAYLEKSDENAEFHQIVDFLSTCSINYALTVSPTIYASYIEQFWNTATSKTVNSVKQIHAIVDGKAVVISESSVRNDLLFDDEDGITCLTNDEIFENLALMGYEHSTQHRLVMKRFEDNTLRDYNLLLWGDLKKRLSSSIQGNNLKKILNWKLEAKAESTMAFELLKFIKSQVEE
ncbi:hypothetical protein Tco_0366251 [Tanacetum coccineum]